MNITNIVKYMNITHHHDEMINKYHEYHFATSNIYIIVLILMLSQGFSIPYRKLA